MFCFSKSGPFTGFLTWSSGARTPGPSACSILLNRNSCAKLTRLPREGARTVSDVIRFPLTSEQAGLLAPLALEAATNHQNMILFSVPVPFRSQQEEIIWELQTVTLSAKLGQKILTLINGSKN
jgi:hypothetical protein